MTKKFANVMDYQVQGQFITSSTLGKVTIVTTSPRANFLFARKEMPIADAWLSDAQVAEVRAKVKSEVGDVELTTKEDIFTVFGL
jgi:hypothetical protein